MLSSIFNSLITFLWRGIFQCPLVFRKWAQFRNNPHWDAVMFTSASYFRFQKVTQWLESRDTCNPDLCRRELGSWPSWNQTVLTWVAVLKSFHGFSCGDSNPLRDVFAVQRPAGVTMETTTEQKTTDQEEKPEWALGEVSLIYNEEAGTQILQHRDSQIDYCSISSKCSLELLASDCSSTAGLASSASQSSVPPPPDPEETGRDQDQQAPANPESDPDTAETVKPTPPQLQAFTVLPVNGSLWIPRYEIPGPTWFSPNYKRY